MEEIRRLLSLISYLKEHPKTRYAELAKLLGVSEKQIREDVRKLLLCGVPPYYPSDYIAVYDDGETVTVDFVDHFRRPVRLSAVEFAALKTALDQMQTLYPENEQLLEQLRDKLKKAASLALEEDEDVALVEQKTGTQKLKNKMRFINHAISECKKLRIEYLSFSEKKLTLRKVVPYLVIRFSDKYYLRGFCELRNAERAFRLDRIKSLEITDETFEPLSEAALEKLAKRRLNYVPPRKLPSLEVFKVRFAPAVARFVEEDWDKKRIEKKTDGSIIFTAPILDEDWTIRYVLSFGVHAELLEPARLRKKIREQAERILENLRE